MKVICFNGNLGNQIFYCRYKDYLQKKYPNENIYYYVTRKCPKVRVQNMFELELPKRSKVVNALTFVIFEILGVLIRRLPQNMVPGWYCSNKGPINDDATFMANYLQDKSFYEHESSDWLKVRMPGSVSEKYLRFEMLIGSSNSVAIHVRRSDYVAQGSAYFDLSSSDYYDKAIAMAKEKYPDAKFFFFSDDLNYVKQRFNVPNSYYVDCNRGANSYLDIKLMSLAKVNIMANSTFSYWAAYINNEHKTVIYPSMWFNKETERKAPDIMLDSWIII